MSLWRTKRSADSEITTGLLQPDEEDFMEFLGDFADFKGSMATKMGNLTCVLTEMNLLTSELKVNIEEYTKDLSEYEEYDLSESPIVEDPEWRARLSRGYQDCYDISESIPSAALSGSPLKRVFGRQMIFFKCAKVTCMIYERIEFLNVFSFLEKRDDQLRSRSDEEVGGAILRNRRE